MLDQVDFEELQEMLNPMIVNNPPVNLDMVDLNFPVQDDSSDITVTFSSHEQSSSDSVQGNPMGQAADLGGKHIIDQEMQDVDPEATLYQIDGPNLQADNALVDVPVIQAEHHIPNLQIGMLLIPEIQHVNLVPSQMHELPLVPFFSKEGTAAWKKFFCPTDNSVDIISIPACWADFFTAKLLTPTDFEWARSILVSKLWSIFSDSTDGVFREFALPKVCPTAAGPNCFLQAQRNNISKGFYTPNLSENML